MFGIKPVTALTFVCLTFAGAAWLRAEDRMRAGLWAVTTTESGTPAGTPINTCYTAAMVVRANLPAKALQESTEKMSTQRGCTIQDFKIEGKSMTMTKTCGAKSSVISSTYSGDAFETVDKTTTAGVTVTIRMTGKRIGECK